MIHIRRATNEDVRELSELAYESKAYWGYSEAFMEACREDLTITEEQLASTHLFVLEAGQKIKGFIGLEQDALQRDKGLVTDLFIHPNAIGQGYGQALWHHMIAAAQKLGIQTLLVHSDPNAEPFYMRMGARRIGEIASTIFPGRQLPLLEFRLESPAQKMQNNT
ncbi:GNAT family N-acetyltransferase [Paenibacillus alvei]|uniref:GNAT family N-acetyltransferase n=1 Tax=Paenibacillus alvei TaxID=44250 RepID=UPI0019D5660B|nr:GNAT family N-acetyltransferase [Paenibacillus alvei]MCY9578806.1 GNAT family N-acetyltransferase [Paenibacillus alvei]MCY9583862.1 GNAT family N-acetyltransferase [Paenibacillus alvei]